MGLRFLDEQPPAQAASPEAPAYDWRPTPPPVNPADRNIIPEWLPKAANAALDWGQGGPIIRAGINLAKNLPSPAYWFMSPEQKERLREAVPSDIPRLPPFPEQSYSFRDIATSPVGQAAYQSVRDVANIVPNAAGPAYNFVRNLHPEKVFPFDVPPLPEREFAPVAPQNVRQVLGKPASRNRRPLPKEGALYFMHQAKGDIELARKMALDAGYTF